MEAMAVERRRLVCLADLNSTRPKSVQSRDKMYLGNKKDNGFLILLQRLKEWDFEGNDVEGGDYP